MVILTSAALGLTSEGGASVCRAIRANGAFQMDVAAKNGAHGRRSVLVSSDAQGGFGAANDRDDRLLELLSGQALLQSVAGIEQDAVLDRGFGPDLDP